MQNIESSSHSGLRRFVYGFVVIGLATVVIAVAFVPRSMDVKVASVTLKCVGTQMEPSRLWNTLLPADEITAAANQANLFRASVSNERRRDYLRPNFRLRTRPGKSPDASFAMLRIDHPHGERAKQFLSLLAKRVSKRVAAGQLSPTVAEKPNTQESPDGTIHVVYRSAPTTSAADVDQASLILDAPAQANEIPLLDGPNQSAVSGAIDEVRKKLNITRKRHRALADAAGRESVVTENMAWEVDRLEGILRDLERAAQTESIAYPAESNGSTMSPFQFVSTQSEASEVTAESPSGELVISVIQEPEIVDTRPGNVSRTSFLVVLAVSGGLGVLAGWFYSRTPAIQFLTARRDVEQAIEAPILGSVFPSREKAPAPKASPLVLIGRGWVRAGEFSLFLFCGFIVFNLATDKAFGKEFASNPLGTYAASVDSRLFPSRNETELKATGELPADDSAETPLVMTAR